MEPKTPKYASYFGNATDISEEERVRIYKEIEKLGGLTFEIEKHEDGWMAQCNQVKGIIAGNTNPNPSDIEVESQIRESIFAAFNVKRSKGSVASPLKFEYSFTANKLQHGGRKN
jgi:hypothetical protein